MAEKELRTLLRQLHDELERVDSIDAPTGELLEQVREDIRARLDEAHERHADSHRTIGERLNDALEHLGEDHPDLALNLRRALEILGRLGI